MEPSRSEDRVKMQSFDSLSGVFLGKGMANDANRATVSGIKRESTEKATAFASQKNGRKGQAGTKKKGAKTKKVSMQRLHFHSCLT